jgi:hypothetical protein
MRQEIVELLKRITDPQMRTSDVPDQPDTPTGQLNGLGQEIHGFLHTDSGIVFNSRAQIKKAIRICWGKPNPIRARNRDRFTLTLRKIIRENDIDIPKMIRAEINDRISNAAGMSLSQNSVANIIAAEVRNQVSQALGGKSMAAFVKQIALEEAKRLIVENLTIDMTVRGDVHTAGNRNRPIRLEGDD